MERNPKARTRTLVCAVVAAVLVYAVPQLLFAARGHDDTGVRLLAVARELVGIGGSAALLRVLGQRLRIELLRIGASFLVGFALAMGSSALTHASFDSGHFFMGAAMGVHTTYASLAAEETAASLDELGRGPVASAIATTGLVFAKVAMVEILSLVLLLSFESVVVRAAIPLSLTLPLLYRLVVVQARAEDPSAYRGITEVDAWFLIFALASAWLGTLGVESYV